MSLLRAPGAIVSEPTADEGTDESGDHDDRAKAHRRLAARYATDSLEKRGLPKRESAQSKCVGGIPQYGEKVRLVAQQCQISRGDCGRRLRVRHLRGLRRRERLDGSRDRWSR